MKSLLHQLEQNLNKAADLYKDIVEVSSAKQQTIVCADIEGLEQAVNAERDLLEKASDIERARQRIHFTIARNLGLLPEELKVATIIKALPHLDTAGLQEAHARLKEVIGVLKKITETNAFLADTSLKLMNEIHRAVFQTSQEEQVYSRHGAVESAIGERMLVDVAG